MAKTIIVKIKKFSPFKFALHMILRPDLTLPFSSLVSWCMIECRVDMATAENAIYNALEYIKINNLSYQDRNKLCLPSIKNNLYNIDNS